MNWQLKPKAPDKFLAQFPEYSPQVLQLLFNRGLVEQDQMDEFFNPDYEQDLHDPFLMLGMKQGVARIKQAIRKKEKIAVFGDYDADGICGAVILSTAFEKLGADVKEIYIPNRMKEGYGLNEAAIKKLAEQKIDLIVTVDCGVTDVAEVELANSLGIEVLIIDHHQIGKKLPPAKVIIDPWQAKDKYPFKELAGAGVAFKFVQALAKKDAKNLKPGWEKWLLDLVALATVADCMPLLGENRTLVRYGLVVLAQTQRVGLRELMRIAKLKPSLEIESLKTNLDAYSLGFMLAPRLNAAGRIEHASLALELLLCKNRAEAEIMAQKIDEHNRQRQKITADIVAKIEEQIKNADDDSPVILAVNKDWSLGVIGLVAGKIADRHHRPTFVFRQNKEFTRGSARGGIPAFNLIEAISQCSDILKEFGGHKSAAGLELKNENLPIFIKKIKEIASKNLTEADLVPVLEIDLELQAKDVVWQLFDDLTRFEPFGNGNPFPVFLLKNMKISNIKIVGNGLKHLKLELESDSLKNKIFKGIAFGKGESGQDLAVGDKVDLVCEFLVDEWNGSRELQLKIIDLKKSL